MQHWGSWAGSSAIDYLLADAIHVSPGEEAWYTERVLRLPECYACYEPPPDAPDVNALPALADRLVAQVEAVDPADIEAFADGGISDDLAELLDSMFVDQVPIARELMRLLEERGWTGWTKLVPIPGATGAGRSAEGSVVSRHAGDAAEVVTPRR